MSIARLHSRANKEYCILTMRYGCRKQQMGLPVFTFGAEERLLASVLAHVRAKSAGVGAAVLTVGALEGSLARMSPHMTLDTAPVRSLVVAVRTQVRLLACMSAHMLRQVARTSTFVFTVLAHVVLYTIFIFDIPDSSWAPSSSHYAHYIDRKVAE